MAYRILGTDFNDFGSQTVMNRAYGGQSSQVSFETPKGQILFAEQTLEHDFSIQESQYHMQDDVTIDGKGETGLLEIQLNLSDKAIFYHDKSMVAHVAPARSGNIAFLSAEENQARILFQKDVSYTTFDIHLPLAALDRFAGESRLLDNFLSLMKRDISALLTPTRMSISPMIFNTIRDIKACYFEGVTRKIYLESKAFELLAILYEQAENEKCAPTLHPADEEKIHQAADIIRNNLERPLTIIALARKVGINQTKLKAGFKEVFKNTVFGYLQDIRMYEAKRYLLDTRLSVQEIALLVGYQNSSNFSVSFKNTHGVSPTAMRQ